MTDLTEGTMAYAFDAATGRLTTRVYVYDIDEANRTLRVSGNVPGGPEWYWTDTFDEHGNMLRLEHRDGTNVDWINTYEDGVLSVAEIVPQGVGQGFQHSLTTYEYADPTAPMLWTHQETDADVDGVVDSAWDRSLEDARPARAEAWKAGEDTAAAIWTYAYTGERLTTVERDQGFWTGSDGSSDIRFTWTYADGKLRSFEQDGTDSNDDPHIDGVPDYGETYSAECGALFERFPWVGHLPSPNGVYPVYRAPDTWTSGG